MTENIETLEESIPEIRNAKWNDSEHTSFDCELNHTEYGWIPFTVKGDDTNYYCSEIWKNKDSFEIQEFIPIQESLEQLQLKRYHLIDTQIEAYLDAKIKEHNYKSVESCVSYYNSTDDKYRAEARAVSEWRDHIYRTGEEVWKSVLNGLVDYKDVDLDYIINIAGDFSWETNV